MTGSGGKYLTRWGPSPDVQFSYDRSDFESGRVNKQGEGKVWIDGHWRNS